jgi:WD40 repeat protein
MPDGKSMLYTETENEDTYVDAKIIAHSFDTKEKKVIAKGATDPRYIPSAHVLFVRGDVLVAAPFDMTTLAVTGPETPVMEDLAVRAGTGTAHYAVSDTGLFLHLNRTGGGFDENTLVWVDRAGNVEQASRHSGPTRGLALSPDGTHIAICMNGATTLPPDIWVIELERDMLTRLTVHDGSDRMPLWSPDQQWIYFSSERETGSQQVWRKRADGTGEVERVATSPDWQYPNSISPDGKILVFTEGEDIYTVHMSGEKKGVPEPFLATQFEEYDGQVSPDGQWIAYVSDVTGQPEIYVQRFPAGGDRVKISAELGTIPRWSPDGSEIIYVDDTNSKYYSVSVAVQDGTFRAQLPELIFQMKKDEYSLAYDLSNDGKRFLFRRAGQANVDSSRDPTLIVNWFKELRMKTSTTNK